MRKGDQTVVVNMTDIPIFVCTSWEPDGFGGPAIRKVTVCIEPGKGATLETLGLAVKKVERRGRLPAFVSLVGSRILQCFRRTFLPTVHSRP